MRPGVLPMKPKQSDRVDWWDILSAEETEIPKFPHQDHDGKFFVSQGVVRKKLVQRRTANAYFYKGAIDRLL